MIRTKLILVLLGSMLAGTAAFADGTAPISEPRHDRRQMDCRFFGTFGDPKSGGNWEVCCRADAQFELSDKSSDRNEQERDKLRVTCEASGMRPETIYDDGLQIRRARGWSDLSSNREDLIFSGVKRHSPEIFVNDVDLHDDSQTRRAVLNYQNDGFTYTLQGECKIKEESHPTIDVLQ